MNTKARLAGMASDELSALYKMIKWIDIEHTCVEPSCYWCQRVRLCRFLEDLTIEIETRIKARGL